jgi:hypothetical protein
MRADPILLSGLAAAFVAGAVLAGCAPANRDELAKEVLAADPSFAAVLERRRELANRIDTYERELVLKRSTVEQTIRQLRQDLASSAKAVRAKTEETRTKLEPERERLAQALVRAAEELKAKRVERAAIGRSISQLRKSLTSSSVAWTDEERTRQAASADEMVRDAARVDHELATLKAHVRLLKIKLLLMKL